MSYRKIRDDFWEHPRTAALSLLARDLFWQGVTASILGVSQYSVRQLARRAGSTPADVSASLAELQSREVAVWWEDFECLWIIEAMDENLDNESAKSAAVRAAESLPRPVIQRIAERYPWISDGRHLASDTLSRQEKEQYSRPGAGAGGDVRPPQHTIRIVGREADPLLDAINEALGVSIGQEQHARFYTSAAERVADGDVTPAEIGAVLRAWQLDDKAKRPDRRKLFYAKQWPWTRKRYLDTPAPEESCGEATGRPEEPPEQKSPVAHEIVADLTRRFTGRHGGESE